MTAPDASDDGAPLSRTDPVRSWNQDFSIGTACLILSNLGNIVNKNIHFRDKQNQKCFIVAPHHVDSAEITLNKLAADPAPLSALCSYGGA